MQPEGSQQAEQAFNLDVYRALLERLQMSQRNKQRLEKKLPANFDNKIVS